MCKNKTTVDTFTNRKICCQFTFRLKGCMYMCFDMVNTAFSLWKDIGRLLIS